MNLVELSELVCLVWAFFWGGGGGGEGAVCFFCACLFVASLV